MNQILEFYASVGILASEAGGLSDVYQRTEPVYIFEDEKLHGTKKRTVLNTVDI